MNSSPHIEDLARTHYENFSVASRLLPDKLRAPIRTVYAFARTADDLADEGQHTIQQRLDALQAMADTVCAIAEGQPTVARHEHWLWRGVHQLFDDHRPPVRYFLDLISAFQQDVRVHRYTSQTEIAEYTRRSADPIGRLVLYLSGMHRAPWLSASDKVCSALQLLNFYQDIGSDLRDRQRLYIADQVLQRYRLNVPLNAEGRWQEEGFDWSSLNPVLFDLTHQASAMLDQGRRELSEIGGWLQWELRLTCLAGLRVGKKLLRRVDPTVSPRLHIGDRCLLLCQLIV